MTLPLDFKVDAVRDVDSAFAWYEGERAGLGERFFEALLTKLDDVRANPLRWAVLRRNVRACQLSRFPYVIYYRIRKDRIEILAVHHAHRNPRSWTDRI